MRVAIVHYWLFMMRGGEKVLEAICETYPDADIYTHVYDAKSISPTIKRHKVFTTYISKLPFSRQLYQFYLPFMPGALEALDMTGYDLVISMESGPAKGVITRPDAMHVCYCFSPMRYLWDHYHPYRSRVGFFKRFYMSMIMPQLRIWDVTSSMRVDHFIAISNFINRRIWKFYHRQSDVLFAFADTDRYSISRDGPKDFYLCLGQLVSYKRADLAVEAFTRLGKHLIVVGTGAEAGRLKKMAGPNIEFRGWAGADEIPQLLRDCKAMIFPGEEDFGITVLEAQASGRPVIAFKAGGALDTIVDGETGLFFEEQTVEALAKTVERFEKQIDRFKPDNIRKFALQFTKSKFKERFKELVDGYLFARKREMSQAANSPQLREKVTAPAKPTLTRI
jgi:glycosyltransferase involved in cell wall biosynthesis